MLIDKQQKSSETLQEYVQRFSDLLLKSSRLLPHQAKDLAHIMHFIRNLQNKKLQHYVLGENPISVQNTITLAPKSAPGRSIPTSIVTTMPPTKVTL